MKVKIPFHIIFDDLFIPFIKRNIKKILFALIVIFLCIFAIFYLLNKKKQENENLLNTYLSAINDFSQNNEEIAIKKLQHVYNSSNDILEILSLLQIIDITIQRQQYTVIPQLLEEILSSQSNPEIQIILYSKGITILEEIKQRNVLKREKYEYFIKQFKKKIKKINSSENLDSNKNTLLLILNENIKPAKTENKLSNINTIIAENK
jgi:hypothetical protein